MRNTIVRKKSQLNIDYVLLFAVMALIGIGIVMVTSASMALAEKQFSDPFYYTKRQMVFACMGVSLAYLVTCIRMVHWEKSGMSLMLFALFLLVLVLIPGVGKTVNGSTRWLDLGLFGFQASEVARLLLLIYLSGYLVRRGEEVRNSLQGFLKPMLIMGIASVLILVQPDFGSVVVLLLTVMALMFIAGVRLFQFVVFIIGMTSIFFALAISSPYRLQRMTAFLDPWADPFNSGFQLTQSLMAFGSGGFLGAGLGDSVQKLFYLPEAHNDFLFAILAEELGLMGVVIVLMIFALLIVRAFRIAVFSERQGNLFGAYVAYAVALWFALQVLVNAGVNMGILPTKGLTLPLMSAGGSSLLIMSIAIGFLFRVNHEAGMINIGAVHNVSATKASQSSAMKQARAA